jgi:DNA polymerase
VSEEVIDRIKARARLALRAERAMGLRMLPIVRKKQAANAAPASARTVFRDAPVAMRPPAALRAPAPTPPAPVAPKSSLFVTPAAPIAVPSEPFTAPLLDRGGKIARLRALDENQVRNCTKCRLCETRTHTVFGEGDPDARVMFIGEGPGANEDQTGRPFVGDAGALLDKMIVAMGLRRDTVFICNLVKCRPPGNREPAPDETATCTPYLMDQVEIVRPAIIVSLGRPASQYLLNSKLPMGRLRGQWHDWRGIAVMPTYHPAYVLRAYTKQTRAAVWSDLTQVVERLKAHQS